MSKHKLLLEYKENVEKVRKRAKARDLNDKQINEIFENCFKHLKNKASSSNVCVHKSKAQNVFIWIFKAFLCFTGFLFVFYIILNVHQPTTSIVLRNVQGLIYPGLKLIRYFSVPIIKRFPQLTELYDESCLIENPFFYVNDMECWPCENVHAVIDLTGFNNHSLYQSGIPYIVKTSQKEVTHSKLKETYRNNEQLFKENAFRIFSSDSNIKTLDDLMNYSLNGSKSSNAHFSWRINRIAPARILRTLFPKPYIMTKWSGQSVERYVFIDEPAAHAYKLPSFECSYVFLIQGSGQRVIVLKPSKECGEVCKTVSVVLKSSYVLWYNWWYWRPISLPYENSTEASISYISSYC